MIIIAFLVAIGLGSLFGISLSEAIHVAGLTSPEEVERDGNEERAYAD